MPWQECNQMDERIKFVARLLDGEQMLRKGRGGSYGYFIIELLLNVLRNEF